LDSERTTARILPPAASTVASWRERWPMPTPLLVITMTTGACGMRPRVVPGPMLGRHGTGLRLRARRPARRSPARRDPPARSRPARGDAGRGAAADPFGTRRGERAG